MKLWCRLMHRNQWWVFTRDYYGRRGASCWKCGARHEGLK